MKYTFKKPKNKDSTDRLSERKSYQFFTHKSNRFFYQQQHGKPQGNYRASNPSELPLPTGTLDHHITHPSLTQPYYSGPSLNAFSYSNVTISHWLQWAAPHPPQIAPSHGRSAPPTILHIQPTLMVSKSAQSFFHSSPDTQTPISLCHISNQN